MSQAPERRPSVRLLALDNRTRLLLAIALFAFAVGIAVLRVGFLMEVGGVRFSATYVMHDFYATAYEPARAILEGRSPYAVGYPPFAPTHLLVHLPFALLSPRTAGVAYFLFTVLLTVPLAHVVLRLVRIKSDSARVLSLAAAILLSRPGHWTLLVGQLSILLTVLAYVTFLLGQTRPFLAGWALSTTIFKPNWGVPLALLLWAWGRQKTAAIGVGLAVLLNVPLVALLAAREGGLRQLIGQALSAYQKFEGLVDPVTHKHRIDATSLISRFVGVPLSTFEQILLSAGVLLLSASVLRLLAKHATQAADTAAIGIICLATSLVGYHQGYDLVLLSAPFLAAAMPGSSTWMPRGLRITVLTLFSILALNWISTESVIAALQPAPALLLVFTSVNGFCVVGLFLAYLALGLEHVRKEGQARGVESRALAS